MANVQKVMDIRKGQLAKCGLKRKIALRMTQPAPQLRPFESYIMTLYGQPGVGKSRFFEQLGMVLQNKYSLTLPGVYMLQCEPVNHRWSIRGAHQDDYLDTWPTLVGMIDDIEKDTKFVASIKMFGIDTIDSMVPKLLNKLCDDNQILDPRDKAWGGVWNDAKDEMEYQILRLLNLGTGVLILSHERTRPVKRGNLEVEQASLDLSNSMFNMIADRSSMVMHMRTAEKGGKAKGRRVLVVAEDATEFAKDNLGMVRTAYKDGLEFDDEREAVDKLLACFGSGQVKHSVVKKKVSKKVSKKVTRRS